MTGLLRWAECAGCTQASHGTRKVPELPEILNLLPDTGEWPDISQKSITTGGREVYKKYLALSRINKQPRNAEPQSAGVLLLVVGACMTAHMTHARPSCKVASDDGAGGRAAYVRLELSIDEAIGELSPHS